MGVGRKCVVETQSPRVARCLQRERKKQEEQLSLTMDLPLISHVSKGLIQSPGSLEAVFKQTSQDMFILMADIPFFGLERFVSLSIRQYMMQSCNCK